MRHVKQRGECTLHHFALGERGVCMGLYWESMTFVEMWNVSVLRFGLRVFEDECLVDLPERLEEGDENRRLTESSGSQLRLGGGKDARKKLSLCA